METQTVQILPCRCGETSACVDPGAEALDSGSTQIERIPAPRLPWAEILKPHLGDLAFVFDIQLVRAGAVLLHQLTVTAESDHGVTQTIKEFLSNLYGFLLKHGILPIRFLVSIRTTH